MKKRITSILLVLVMILGLFPGSVMAGGAVSTFEIEHTGTQCGDLCCNGDVQVGLPGRHVFTADGTVEMSDEENSGTTFLTTVSDFIENYGGTVTWDQVEVFSSSYPDLEFSVLEDDPCSIEVACPPVADVTTGNYYWITVYGTLTGTVDGEAVSLTGSCMFRICDEFWAGETDSPITVTRNADEELNPIIEPKFKKYSLTHPEGAPAMPDPAIMTFRCAIYSSTSCTVQNNNDGTGCFVNPVDGNHRASVTLDESKAYCIRPYLCDYVVQTGTSGCDHYSGNPYDYKFIPDGSGHICTCATCGEPIDNGIEYKMGELLLYMAMENLGIEVEITESCATEHQYAYGYDGCVLCGAEQSGSGSGGSGGSGGGDLTASGTVSLTIQNHMLLVGFTIPDGYENGDIYTVEFVKKGQSYGPSYGSINPAYGGWNVTFSLSNVDSTAPVTMDRVNVYTDEAYRTGSGSPIYTTTLAKEITVTKDAFDFPHENVSVTLAPSEYTGYLEATFTGLNFDNYSYTLSCNDTTFDLYGSTINIRETYIPNSFTLQATRITESSAGISLDFSKTCPIELTEAGGSIGGSSGGGTGGGSTGGETTPMYDLSLSYDDSLCTVRIYDGNTQDEDEPTVFVTGDGQRAQVPQGSWLIFDIYDIKEGYRIKSVTLNGTDYTDGFIDGGYGGMGISDIERDYSLVAVMEKVPDPLPAISDAFIYLAGAAGTPITSVTFSDALDRVYANVSFSDGEDHPDYFARCEWEYSTDNGATWQEVPGWGWHDNFYAAWSWFESEYGMDFMTMQDYLLRVHATPKQDYSIGSFYSIPITVNPSGGGSTTNKLSAPTQLEWGPYYGDTDEAIFNYNGMISWVSDTTQPDHEVAVKVFNEAGEEFWDSWWLILQNSSPHSNDWDFINNCHLDLPSGRYRFSLQSISQDSTYSNSDIVYSDWWEYTNPGKQLPAPTNLRWNGMTATWAPVDDSNTGGYTFSVYYSPDDPNATSIQDLTRVRGYMWYLAEGWRDNSFTLDERMLEKYGPGYYYFTTETLPADVEVSSCSETSVLSSAIYYNGTIPPDITVDINGTLAEVTAPPEELDKLVEQSDGSISIDLGDSEELVAVHLPGTLMESISTSGGSHDLDIQSGSFSVTLSSDVAETVAGALSDESDILQIIVNGIEQTRLNSAQQGALDQLSEAVECIFDVSMYILSESSDGKSLHELDGYIDVTLRLPFTPGAGQSIVVAYLADDGSVEYMETSYSGQTATFRTNHCSDFVVLSTSTDEQYELTALTLRSMAGNKLLAIPSGSFRAEVDVRNQDAMSNGVLMLAAYDKDGRFVTTQTKDISDIPTGQSSLFSFTFDNPKGNIASIKAFCVDSSANLTPLGDARGI